MLAVRAGKLPMHRLKIGHREIVGPSSSGLDIYYDRVDIPCPPIRWKPPSDEFNSLMQKEKGDWKSLSVEDKRRLYRLNYRQTFAEMEAPTAEGRRIFGTALLLLSIPITMYALMKLSFFPPMPESMSDKGKKQMVRWYIDSRAEPLDGVASKWDYEKGQWKEKPYSFMKIN